MSVINSQPLIGASGQGGAYNLTRSLRFRSSASAYLNRTPASAGNRQKWTWSGWVKKGALGSSQSMLDAYTAGSTYGILQFLSTDIVQWYDVSGGSATMHLETTQVFRDPSAWYHLVFAYDSTQATSSNRAKLYVNGVQITSFSTTSYPAQNTNSNINNNIAHDIGRFGGGSNYLDGYLTEVNFVDGQQLEPASFGETDTATGVWKPKKYTGTYGTNGFYLKFDNLTSTSTLGNDSSGNSNTWTVNNISLTSGSTYDSMKDVPTLTDADTANYCVLNPLNNISTAGSRTIDNGNLRFFSTSSLQAVAYSSINLPTTGKFYYEVLIDSAGATSTTTTIYCGGAYYYQNGTRDGSTAYGASWTTNDVIGVAVDIDAGSVTFYKNNSSQGARTSLSPANDISFYCNFDGSNRGCSINFGQRPFAYTPPSGFKALNTFNLPTPTIGATASTQANDYFDVSLWTGNGSTQSITNSGSMQPDFVWIKGRSTAWGHRLADAVRGVGKELFSNDTSAELTNNSGGYLTAFNSNGFSINSGAGVNTNNDTYVAWQWKANGAGSSNTAGSITSTVSANTTAGFSIVTYTGNGTQNATVGHGLGVTPKLHIIKNRSATANWVVLTTVIDGSLDYAYLNSTAAFGNAAQNASTSTVFSVWNDTDSNTNGNNYVAYCFAEVAGYSKFGSYTGNGSTDGTFVFTGFRPRYLLVKRTDTTSVWSIWDTARNTINAAGSNLWTDSSEAETTSTAYDVDFLSNGFKLRNSHAARNASGGTYIFAAFADTPFKYSLGR